MRGLRDWRVSGRERVGVSRERSFDPGASRSGLHAIASGGLCVWLAGFAGLGAGGAHGGGAEARACPRGRGPGQSDLGPDPGDPARSRDADRRRDAIATGQLVSHPSGLARLELRGSGGRVDRYLLSGSELLAAKDGEALDDPQPILQPIFLLQPSSQETLRVALESFGVDSRWIGVAPCGELDCYVFGDPALAAPEVHRLPLRCPIPPPHPAGSPNATARPTTIGRSLAIRPRRAPSRSRRPRGDRADRAALGRYRDPPGPAHRSHERRDPVPGPPRPLRAADGAGLARDPRARSGPDPLRREARDPGQRESPGLQSEPGSTRRSTRSIRPAGPGVPSPGRPDGQPLS
jgi:hypothetical protein